MATGDGFTVVRVRGGRVFMIGRDFRNGRYDASLAPVEVDMPEGGRALKVAAGPELAGAIVETPEGKRRTVGDRG